VYYIFLKSFLVVASFMEKKWHPIGTEHERKITGSIGQSTIPLPRERWFFGMHSMFRDAPIII